MDLRRITVRPLLAYYLGGTPLFFLLDIAWDLSVRASFFDDLPARLAYYAVCLGCGVVAWRWPERASLVGLGESAVNIALLVIGFMLPIFGVYEALLEDPHATVGAPTPEGILNFAIGAGIGWWSLQRRLLGQVAGT